MRVDCYAGGTGDLVRYYTRHGFTPTESFVIDGWPGPDPRANESSRALLADGPLDTRRVKRLKYCPQDKPVYHHQSGATE